MTSGVLFSLDATRRLAAASTRRWKSAAWTRRLNGVVLLLGLFASPVLAASGPTTKPAGFKYVSVTTDLDESGLPKRLHRREVYFIGDKAFCVDAEGLPDLVIDLQKQTATDEQGNRMSLPDLQARWDRERGDARAKIDKLRDQNQIDRARYDVDPALAVTEENGKLIATNPLVRYEIEPAQVDEQYRGRLYQVIRLFTLAGASATQRPYVPLAVTDELERRGVIAADAKATIKSGNKQSEMRIQSRLTPLSEEDQKRLATMLLPAGGF
jgi:hypothetical protein